MNERAQTGNPVTVPIAAIDGAGLVIQATDGQMVKLSADAALEALSGGPYLICHAAYIIGRLGFAGQRKAAALSQAARQPHFDLAELFAFAAPAVMATPTPEGFARAVGISPGLQETETMQMVADELLMRLSRWNYPHLRETAQAAHFLKRTNWPWAPAVIAALTTADPNHDVQVFATGLNAWDRLPEWEDDGPRPPGSHEPVAPEEATKFLKQLLGSNAEARPQQLNYCAEATGAFQPRQSRSQNHILLAEAGTGLGKTLGYLAPAYLWARRNHAPVWVSTFTKNLQRQLEQETRRIVDDPDERRHRIVVRKGRENYACLLNIQEAFARMGGTDPKASLFATLIARWLRASKDGDMVGGDFPAWLMGLLSDDVSVEARVRSPMSLGLTDRRGECIYSACPHYRKCFIERAQRAARKADIVIANHALVLHAAALEHALGETGEDDEEASQPDEMLRLVFDEGHHLFDAADSAFSGHLTGLEMAELRRWVRGSETRSRRGRSLEDRVGDLAADSKAGEELLSEIRNLAGVLPGPGWQRRIKSGMPDGAAENFLILARQQVHARQTSNTGHNLETDCRPMVDNLSDAASALASLLIDLKKPMGRLAKYLLKRLDNEADELNSSERARIEALARSLRRRGELMIGGWNAMLSRLLAEPDAQFIDWFSIEYQFGREIDVGLHSHWIDPSEPFAAVVLSRMDGVIITSATLKDRPPEAPDDWQNAEMRTGAVHLPWPVERAQHASPFDYAANARILVVNDINRDDMGQLAAAYRELFTASGGSALGLFTAISRLKAVYRRIAAPVAEAGLPLFAQHVDPMDTGTLVDMFRAERKACLLGTDAVRDGVDVPGDALRLLVLDRVPWSQPSILERARRKAFGGNSYQDMIVRLKLRQAFGRLIRRADDRGVFVILDSRLASRFCTAFPTGVEVERIGLVDAIGKVREFLNPCPDQS